MTLRIRMPDDFHAHLRQGAMLRSVLPYTAGVFGRALVMPNTEPPIETAEDVNRYAEEIWRAATSEYTTNSSFQPLMTIKLTRRTTPGIVHAARAAGAVAAKFYPEGATTNASGGYGSLREVPRDVLAAIAASGLVLSIHAEDPSAFVMDREARFLGQIDDVLGRYRLRVVVEHLTSRVGVEWVRSHDSHYVAATITAHHLWTTLDDVVGGGLDPHAFCKPVPKTPDDRQALIDAATEGDDDRRFFFGSDSAPHPRGRKECASGCAGAFTAPVALPLLAEVFESACSHNWVHALEEFVSKHGARFYGWTNAGMEFNRGSVTLAPEAWKVPAEIDGVVPFLAGREMRWRVTNVDREREPG